MAAVEWLGSPNAGIDGPVVGHGGRLHGSEIHVYLVVRALHEGKPVAGQTGLEAKGFAIGTGGIGVTLLGVVADRYGVAVAAHLINVLPAVGALLALGLPLPWRQPQQTAA